MVISFNGVCGVGMPLRLRGSNKCTLGILMCEGKIIRLVIP